MLYFMVFFYSPNNCNWYNSSLWVLVYLPLNWPLYDLEVRSRKNLREPASQTASFRRGDGCEMRRLNGVTSRQFLEFWGAETPLSTSTEPSNDAGGTHQLMFPHWGYCGLISNGALACIEYKILFLFCFFFCFIVVVVVVLIFSWGTNTVQDAWLYREEGGMWKFVYLAPLPPGNSGVTEAEPLVLQLKMVG